MLTDKTSFSHGATNDAFKKFSSDLDLAVAKGKIRQLDAIGHIDKLRAYASEQNHEAAAKYMEDHNKKLGFYNPTWQSDEKWGK